jgi:hypothetical protein
MYLSIEMLYKPLMSSTSLFDLELDAACSGFPMEGLGRLGAHLPLAWIEEALAATGTASIRRRRLPAEQVVWLVIALALYRRTSLREHLQGALKEERRGRQCPRLVKSRPSRYDVRFVLKSLK